MSIRLPKKGLWHVSNRHRADAAPFDLIKLDLRDRGAGSVRARNLETRLQRVRVAGPDRFVANYDIRGHSGIVEGTLRQDGSLRLDVSGTVTGTFVARAVEPAGADASRPVQALSDAVEVLRRSAGMVLTAAA